MCPSTYLSCSAGICSNEPAVQLVEAIPIPDRGGNVRIDDKMYPLHLPVNITLYNYSTSNVTVSSNGVSYLKNDSQFF